MRLAISTLIFLFLMILVPSTQPQNFVPVQPRLSIFGQPGIIFLPPGADPRPRPGSGSSGGKSVPKFKPPPFVPPYPNFVPVTPRPLPPPPPSFVPSYPKYAPIPFPIPVPHFPAPPQKSHPRPTVDEVVQRAYQRVLDEDNTMKSRLDQGIDKRPEDLRSPDPLLFSESPEDSRFITRQSRIINWIARLLKSQQSPFSLDDALGSSTAQAKGIKCPFVRPQSCPPGIRYRPIDGKCNNVHHPLWGAAFTPFTRLLQPEYQTDILAGRDDLQRHRSNTHQELPSARLISTTVHEPIKQGSEESIFSMALTLWGQFLAHDLTDRAPNKGYDESVLKCCKQTVIKTPASFCFNIPIPNIDIFRQFKGDCLEFARSAEVTDLDCKRGQREQLNQATSFIDGGAIYGAKATRITALRKFSGGLMLTSEPDQLPMLPHGNSVATSRGYAFYLAGDNRVNEYTGLMGIETIWIREHNRIAKQLSMINRHWSDEVIFQETRHIIVAVVQHITYNEYLPTIVGPAIVKQYNLKLLYSGYSNHYNGNVNPSLSNVFVTGALRFGHSMVRTVFSLRTKQNSLDDYSSIKLGKTFFRPQTFLLHEDPLMRGYVADGSKTCDRVVSNDLINNLYETEPGTGGDLAAANIQRGRDHGLGSYNTWRKKFGLSEAFTFDATNTGFKDIPAEAVIMLDRAYRFPPDVDMWTGGVSEKPMNQAAVGPLFGNIIAQQFEKLKFGDRYWYETQEHPQRFTPGQLNEIRKVSIARVFCDAFDFAKIQPRAFFKKARSTNQRVPCSNIPQINLAYWKEAV